LQAFGDKHADARNWIEGWLADAELSAWATSHDVKERYPSVSFLSGGIVIFNVKGNLYRLETVIAYRTQVVLIQWIGTHAEYDKRNKQR
jgi:mRNA interferase HigB